MRPFSFAALRVAASPESKPFALSLQRAHNEWKRREEEGERDKDKNSRPPTHPCSPFSTGVVTWWGVYRGRWHAWYGMVALMVQGQLAFMVMRVGDEGGLHAICPLEQLAFAIPGLSTGLGALLWATSANGETIGEWKTFFIIFGIFAMIQGAPGILTLGEIYIRHHLLGHDVPADRFDQPHLNPLWDGIRCNIIANHRSRIGNHAIDALTEGIATLVFMLLTVVQVLVASGCEGGGGGGGGGGSIRRFPVWRRCIR